MCPPVALRLGVALLCRLFQVWDQVAVGVMTLAEWLLGDDGLDASSEEDVDAVSTIETVVDRMRTEIGVARGGGGRS